MSTAGGSRDEVLRSQFGYEIAAAGAPNGAADFIRPKLGPAYRSSGGRTKRFPVVLGRRGTEDNRGEGGETRGNAEGPS